MTGLAVTGCGSVLPATTVTDRELEQRLDTTDDRTIERTDIRERRTGGTVGDLFVPHQANRRSIEAVAERIGIPLERMAITVERTGNTSAASIPLALAEAADAGRVTEGDTVLVSGVGAGMIWASAVLRWGTIPRAADPTADDVPLPRSSLSPIRPLFPILEEPS